MIARGRGTADGRSRPCPPRLRRGARARPAPEPALPLIGHFRVKHAEPMGSPGRHGCALAVRMRSRCLTFVWSTDTYRLNHPVTGHPIIPVWGHRILPPLSEEAVVMGRVFEGARRTIASLTELAEKSRMVGRALRKIGITRVRRTDCRVPAYMRRGNATSTSTSRMTRCNRPVTSLSRLPSRSMARPVPSVPGPPRPFETRLPPDRPDGIPSRSATKSPATDFAGTTRGDSSDRWPASGR